MCISNLGWPQKISQPIIGYKRVKKISPYAKVTFKSGVPPINRSRQDGYSRVGKVLTYRVGRVTEAPPKSPGIYVYKCKPPSRYDAEIIRVRVPRGATVAYGISIERAFVASEVEVLNVVRPYARRRT